VPSPSLSNCAKAFLIIATLLEFGSRFGFGFGFGLGLGLGLGLGMYRLG
jgi:hypothetical protein